MNKKTVCSILLSITILLFSSQAILAGFQPIYPLEGNILGGKYSYPISSWQPYFQGAYDFEHKQTYYQLGTKYQVNNQLTTGINYNYWLNHDLPGCLYQQGLETNIFYNQNSIQKLNLSLFSGQLGEDFAEEINTNYLALTYNHQLYYDWENRVQLNLDIVSGQETTTDQTYYVSNLKFPVKFNKFTFLPRLGYINQADKIKPHYDLTSYVPGYDSKTGTKVASFKLEHQFELAPYSSWPIISLLNVTTFIAAGDVLTTKETTADFNLHSSIGAGLALNMGQVDFKLTKAITDQGTTKTLLQITKAY